MTQVAAMVWPNDNEEWYHFAPGHASGQTSASAFRYNPLHHPLNQHHHQQHHHHHDTAYLLDTQYMVDRDNLPPPNDIWQPQMNAFPLELDGPQTHRTDLLMYPIGMESALDRDLRDFSYSSATTTATTVSKRDSLSPPASEKTSHGDSMPQMMYAGMMCGSPTYTSSPIPGPHGVTPSDVQQMPDIIETHGDINTLGVLSVMDDNSDDEDTGLPTPSITTPGTVLSANDGDTAMQEEADGDCSTDPDYKPVTRQSKPQKSKPAGRKRASHKRTTSRTSQSGAVSKAAAKASIKAGTSMGSNTKKTLSPTQCPQCLVEHSNKAARDKHIQSAHTRPFSCIFERYGCKATFGAKNEWKRHCSTQHLRLSFYRCDVGDCLPPTVQEKQHLEGWERPIVSQTGCNDFNRKDLFIQHHRRMHAPENLERASQAEKDRVKAQFEQAAIRCHVSARAPPPRTICGLCESKGCPVVFEGARAWETRMEHVGRHLESAKGEHVEWTEDMDLKQWLIDEGLIQQASRGEWKLTDQLKVEGGRASRR